MNIKNIIIISATLALAACTGQDDPWGDKLDEPVVAEFSGNIENVATRASGSSWATNDAIGITGDGFTNIKYVTTAGDGNFAPKSVSEAIFFKTNQGNTEFTAYYPYSDEYSENSGIISANTSSQTAADQAKFDFLWAQASASHDDPTAEFNFKHKMTKLILKIQWNKEESGIAKDDFLNASFALGGVKLNGTFNTTTGKASATGAATENWPISLDSGVEDDAKINRTFRLILFPQSHDTQNSKLTVIVKIGNQDYVCDITPALAAGTSYTYTIIVKKVGLEVSTNSITNWVADGGSYEGTATPYDPFNGHPAVLMREASGTPGTADYVPALYFADRNIGASTPEDAGLYFWWGDVVGHEANSDFDFASDNCPTDSKDLATLYSEGYMTNGTDCNTATLTAQYDAAQKQWQGSWRLPTKAEIEWLINTSNCTREYIAASDGKPAGWQLTSKTTSNSIFIPLSGYIDDTTLIYQTTFGYYWTTTIDEYNTYLFNLSTSALTCRKAFSRYYGYPLRPVATK